MQSRSKQPSETRAVKIQLREQVRSQRAALGDQERTVTGRAVLQRLVELPVFAGAQTIHTFISWRDELDNHALIRDLLQQGRSIIVPKVAKVSNRLRHFRLRSFEELRPGTLGILEPDPAAADEVEIRSNEPLDLILVPGLAFDRSGNRLGYGGGFYDRFLQTVRAPTVAPIFALQLVDAIPTENHDRRVDWIVTEHETIDCRSTLLRQQ